MAERDPYQRLSGMYLEIIEYTDRPTRRLVVNPAQTPIRPFGVDVRILFPDGEADVGTPSIFLFPVDGCYQVTADEDVAEAGNHLLAEFGPFQQVTIAPTIRGARRTKAITYRNLGDLFFHAVSQ